MKTVWELFENFFNWVTCKLFGNISLYIMKRADNKTYFCNKKKKYKETSFLLEKKKKKKHLPFLSRIGYNETSFCISKKKICKETSPFSGIKRWPRNIYFFLFEREDGEELFLCHEKIQRYIFLFYHEKETTKHLIFLSWRRDN